MIVNYESHGFHVTAKELPEACTACPFWGYSATTDTGICGITGTEIDADGPQDTQRMEDCPITEEKIGEWEETEGALGYLSCSVCHDAYILPEWRDSDKWSYCPNCGADLRGEAGHV